MKANEFVKMVGLEEAKGILEAKEFTYRQLGLFSYVHHELEHLKRLVESHELVESLGGLDGAKKKLNSLCIFRWITPEITALEQAIADVEACQ